MVPSDIVMVVRIWIFCSTLLVISIPSQLVRRIYRDKAVGSASIVPILIVFALSHVWMLYGYLGKTWFPSFPVFLIGDIVSLSYLFVYWRYASDRDKGTPSIVLLFTWLAVSTLYVVVASVGFTGQTRAHIWKTQGLCFCDVTVVGAHMPMARTLLHAFKLRSAASLVPRSLAITTFNTLGWFTFGQVTSNWIIAGPQVFVITLHLAAWIIYIVFSRRTNPGADDNMIEKDSILSAALNLSPKVEADVGIKNETALSSPDDVYHALQSPTSVSGGACKSSVALLVLGIVVGFAAMNTVTGDVQRHFLLFLETLYSVSV